jgi:hypothetical protein
MTQRIRGPCCQERGFGTRPVVAYAATAMAVRSLRGPAAARAADVASANTVTAGLAATPGDTADAGTLPESFIHRLVDTPCTPP